MRKEQEELAQQEEKKRKKKETVPKPKKKSSSTNDSEYDEEDHKILQETKSKGYCYFNRKQSEQEKSLIGDITPKSVTHKTATGTSPTVSASSSSNSLEALATATATGTSSAAGGGGGGSEKVGASSWNHAGTWEERDLTSTAVERVKELLGQVEVRLPKTASSSGISPSAPMDTDTRAGGEDSEQQLTSALEHMDMQSTGGDRKAPSASMESTLRGKVTKVVSVDGDAHIVLARGKKRHIYDFTIELEFEIFVEKADGGDSPRTKTVKGTLKLVDVTPLASYESTIKYKKSVSDTYEEKVKEASDALRQAVSDALRRFEKEYTEM